MSVTLFVLPPKADYTYELHFYAPMNYPLFFVFLNVNSLALWNILRFTTYGVQKHFDSLTPIISHLFFFHVQFYVLKCKHFRINCGYMCEKVDVVFI